MPMYDVNVLMVGVGGQGVVLASDAMGEIGMNHGYDVKKSDSLGMAQRGGSVVSHVRCGKHVFSPMIKQGEVDFLLGFEQLETARWASFLKASGVAIVADVTMIPVSVIGGTVAYPGRDEVMEILARYTEEIYLLPATEICLESRNPRALNMVMLGALATFLELETGAWMENLRLKLPPRFVESSLEAFSRGAAAIKAMKTEKPVKSR
ncbi:indolepyruvate oxidoreductase subunit beta [Chloroflexota bacterium]